MRAGSHDTGSQFSGQDLPNEFPSGELRHLFFRYGNKTVDRGILQQKRFFGFRQKDGTVFRPDAEEDLLKAAICHHPVNDSAMPDMKSVERTERDAVFSAVDRIQTVKMFQSRLPLIKNACSAALP